MLTCHTGDNISPILPATWLSYQDSQLYRVTDSLSGLFLEYHYNAFGQILTGTDEAGHLRFSNTFDEQHRLIAQEDGRTENQSLRLSYGTSRPDQRVTTVTQCDGRTKTWVHNAHFQLLQLTDELGHTTTFTYDEHGQRRTATDAAGQTTAFTYTSRGQLHTLTNAAG